MTNNSVLIGDEVKVSGERLGSLNLAVELQFLIANGPTVTASGVVSIANSEIKFTVPSLPAGTYQVIVRIDNLGYAGVLSVEVPL